MFFEKEEDILRLAKLSQTVIFVLPGKIDFEIKNAIVIEPDEKSVITIEQIRQLIQRLSVKQFKDLFVIIRPADLMNDEAANAFLKNLEEPKPKVHFLLITNNLSKLPATIISRSAVYILKTKWDIRGGIDADEKTKLLAKRLMTASGKDLVVLAEEITKHKINTRFYVLEILQVAIEMLYKTYLITNKDVFLRKTVNFLKAYDNIERNGHIKLHLVADLC